MATVLRPISFGIDIKVPEGKSNIGPQAGALDFIHRILWNQDYEIGTGDGKINAFYARPPTAQSAEDIDLRGTLTTLDGSTVAFPIVTGLWIRNHSTTDAEIVSVGGETNPWLTHLGAGGDIIKVQPKGAILLWAPGAGYATTAGTADILTLTPATGNPLVSLAIFGRSS